MIYFLRAGDAVKIGYSDSPETAIRRLTGFQTANAENLELLAVVPGDRSREAWFHRQWAPLRIRGEWFQADPAMIKNIQELADLQQQQREILMAPIPDTPLAFTDLNPTAAPPPRLSSSFRNFDAVLGGGFVPGSTVLLSGDPGAGKSTLLLQVAAYIGCRGYRAAYATAEEAAEQVKLRAKRLGLALAPCQLAATSSVTALLGAVAAAPPVFLVVDSLQTFVDPALTAPRGTPNQTRAVLAALIAHAHATGTVVVVVSHVNKASRAAGTNDLQHDVDVLLHLHALADRRVLRANKNRYGPTDIVGTFRMTAEGVRE
jgi:predicted ATP-dependent serine protease